MKLSNSVLPILAGIQQAQAWGTLGHTTIALIASSLVSPQTTTIFQSILHNDSSNYLGGIATWADSFRYTAAGRFTAPFHFIDAEDNPPESCGVVYKRDCGSRGCVVGAIGNYTKQLLNITLPEWQREQAAKFIVHFLGDIHQPLHAENLAVGGNTIHVFFESKPTNLHHVWDTSIPEKLVGGYALPYSVLWSQNLTTSILSGPYSAVAKTWLDGLSLEDAEGSALLWATESNALVCTTVLKEGRDAINGTELAGSYYDAATAVVEEQVAKAGVRLAKWMDLIAERLIVADERAELKRF